MVWQMNLFLTNWQWQYSLIVYRAHSLDKCAQIITSNTVNLNTSNINMIPHKLAVITCKQILLHCSQQNLVMHAAEVICYVN